MQKRVVQTHPNLAVYRIDRKSGEDGFENRRLNLFFLVLDFFPGGRGFGKGIQASELKVESGITVAVVLPHERLGKVSEAVVQAILRIGRQPADAEIAIQII